jgi:coenzyme F420-reducing hydrogenase beta subunit
MEFPWLRQARSLLETAEGTLAVVGLPCHIQSLHRIEQRRQDVGQKIKMHIALVCSRSSSKDLLIKVLAKKGIDEEDVENIRFREGRWRGQMHVWLKDGSEVVFPFQDFSLYRNLHFYCEDRCLYCEDPLSDQADIVCGDVWLHEMKQEAVKHSLVISRTPQASGWIQAMRADGCLLARTIEPEKAFQAQRRSLIPAKRGKQAKARLSTVFGYRMRHGGPWQSRWNDYLTAALILFAYRWSASRRLAPLIFHAPRPLLNLCLMALSLLKNF